MRYLEKVILKMDIVIHPFFKQTSDRYHVYSG